MVDMKALIKKLLVVATLLAQTQPPQRAWI